MFLPGNEDWQQLPPSEAVLWLFGIIIRGSVSWGTTGAGALSTWGLTESNLLMGIDNYTVKFHLFLKVSSQSSLYENKVLFTKTFQASPG